MEQNNRLNFRTSYIYNFPIEHVYDTLIDRRVFNQIFKDFCSDVNCVRGNKNVLDTGSEIILKYYSIEGEIRFLVEKMHSTENYKHMVFRFETSGHFHMRFLMVVNLYWNTIEKTTLQVTDHVFDDLINFKLANQVFREKDQMNLYKKFNTYLMQQVKKSEQIETIVINTNFETVWNAITDWNIFKSHVPEIGDVITYDGSPYEKGTKMHVYFQNSLTEYHLKVLECSKDESKKKYSLAFYAGKPKSPKQEIHFTFLNIDEAACLLTFEHKFKKYVKHKLLDIISIEKKNILKKLKFSLEG